MKRGLSLSLCLNIRHVSEYYSDMCLSKTHVRVYASLRLRAALPPSLLPCVLLVVAPFRGRALDALQLWAIAEAHPACLPALQLPACLLPYNLNGELQPTQPRHGET